MDNSLLKRREGIIISTIETMNEVGLQNLSTKLIAQREGVSEGTLFRHFKNKTDILLAVLQHFAQYDADIKASAINRNLAPLERIRFIVSTYAEYYENYPEITVILQTYDSLLSDVELADEIKRIINNRFDLYVSYIDDAKKTGDIDPTIDSFSFADLILGGSREVCLRWRMGHYSFSLKQQTNAMLDMLLAGFANGKR